MMGSIDFATKLKITPQTLIPGFGNFYRAALLNLRKFGDCVLVFFWGLSVLQGQWSWVGRLGICPPSFSKIKDKKDIERISREIKILK